MLEFICENVLYRYPMYLLGLSLIVCTILW